MYIAVVNASKELQGQTTAIAAMCSAWTQQLRFHAGPRWGYVPIQATPVKAAPKGTSTILIVDTPDVANALGYHDVDPHGIPYGRVFVKPILDNGGTVLEGDNSVSATGSHEILEMYGDWGANLWADDGTGKQYALEFCDAVEMDSYVIKAGTTNVSVSNFVLPSWFRPSPPDNQFDYLGKLKKPFSMDAGGYLLYREAGEVQSVEGKKSFGWHLKSEFGEDYPEWRKPGKAHPSTRTSRRGKGHQVVPDLLK